MVAPLDAVPLLAAVLFSGSFMVPASEMKIRKLVLCLATIVTCLAPVSVLFVFGLTPLK